MAEAQLSTAKATPRAQDALEDLRKEMQFTVRKLRVDIALLEDAIVTLASMSKA